MRGRKAAREAEARRRLRRDGRPGGRAACAPYAGASLCRRVAVAALRGRNLLLLAVLGALWGTAFLFITLGLPSFSPLLFAALRFDIAGLAILAVGLGLALRKPAKDRYASLLPRGGAQWAAIGIAAVLNVGMYHALLFYGQLTLSPAVAAIIVGLNPILTTLAARAFLSDERVGVGGILGLGLGFLGVVLLALLRPGPRLEPASLLLDDQRTAMLLALGAIASWSVGSTLVRRTKHGMDVYAFTAWQMLVGAALLHAGALAFEGGGYARWDVQGVVALLYLAIVSSSLGFVIYFTLLERVGPIRTNLVSHVAAIFATLAGWVWLHHAPEPRALLAFLLIASGFLLVTRPAATSPRK